MFKETVYNPVLYPKEETYAEKWLSLNVELAAEDKIKLSGADSLYFHYCEECKKDKMPAIPLRSLSKKLELLLAVQHQHVLSKVKTGKGLYLHHLSLRKDGSVKQTHWKEKK